ncbi:Hsp20/alpha crystallin family protein [Eubacteriales bacterium OttesenSCG-928-K08]|nr:Hsp20/alpha crystallin family protein [Eubacteriales bacterium OttesenSCG-928-K08]
MHQSDLDLFLNENEQDYYRQLEDLMFAHRSRYRVDVLDGGDHYDLTAEFPDVLKENIHMDVDGDVLTLRVEPVADEEGGSHNSIDREHNKSEDNIFVRKFNISKVDAYNIKASYDHGILKVVLPKKADSKKNEKKSTIEL